MVAKRDKALQMFGLELRIRREEGITGVKVSSKSYTQNIYDLNLLKDKLSIFFTV